MNALGIVVFAFILIEPGLRNPFASMPTARRSQPPYLNDGSFEFVGITDQIVFNLKVNSDIIYHTYFYREMTFQRYTGAVTLMFFLLYFNGFAGSITVRPKLSPVDWTQSTIPARSQSRQNLTTLSPTQIPAKTGELRPTPTPVLTVIPQS